MDQKCTNDTRFYYNKDLDQNPVWLNEKTEDQKSNNGNQQSLKNLILPPLWRGGWSGGSDHDITLQSVKRNHMINLQI